ncbi:MAG: rRNA pseudouridine synthase [Treponema sp.]|jgi:23S rRNA pseudouridine2605 synthase|nr:rRNA pseudouridine synthase [Treponema sp.]
MRLQVYLAHAGVASRRAAEKLISAGRISVNGAVVLVLGTKVFPQDEVCLDGVAVRLESCRYYLALHKPAGYLCSAADPQGRPLVGELVPKDIRERLYTVGRLDYRSSGLILFTNDGTFAAKVGHPSAGIVKEYVVEASGPIPHRVVEDFVQGVLVEGVQYRAKEIERLGKKALRILLVEGKNREIRRVFSHFHLHPVKLCRIRIGPVPLGDLKPGSLRALTESEYTELMKGPGY